MKKPRTQYTITLSWETPALMESNRIWILRHFRSSPALDCKGCQVKFITGYGSKYRAIRRLATQCGATVLEKTIGGVPTSAVKGNHSPIKRPTLTNLWTIIPISILGMTIHI